MQQNWGFVNMAVKTIPLAQPKIDTGFQLPGLKPALTYGARCPHCQRDYWLTWERDYSAINLEKRARQMRRVEWALVMVFALAAGLFFVGAILYTTGGRL